MAGFADVLELKSLFSIQRWCFKNPRTANDYSNRCENTHVIAIDGNFDDAQTDVKRMFNDVIYVRNCWLVKRNFHQLTQ